MSEEVQLSVVWDLTRQLKIPKEEMGELESRVKNQEMLVEH